MLKLKTNFLKYKDENGDMQDSGMLFAQNETDSTLTKSGVAADAQVVGNKFEELSEQKVNKTGITLDKDTDGLIYIFVDGVKVGNGVEVNGEIIEGDVTGILDENNNILLSGNIADGTYTLKWLKADGTYTDAGTIVVGAVPEPEPVKTNFFDASRGFYGRLSSTGVDRTDAPKTFVTNYIPVQAGDIVEINGCTVAPIFTTGVYPYMTGYDSSKTNVYTENARTSNDYWTFDTLTSTSTQLTVLNDSIAYFRFVCGDSS